MSAIYDHFVEEYKNTHENKNEQIKSSEGGSKNHLDLTKMNKKRTRLDHQLTPGGVKNHTSQPTELDVRQSSLGLSQTKVFSKSIGK